MLKGINGFNYYGDKNLEHGGSYVRENKERDSIELFIISPNESTGLFALEVAEVDNDEPWIQWREVQDTCDTDLANPIQKAMDAVFYYGIANFGSTQLQGVTLEEIIINLKESSIVEEEVI